MNNNFDPERVRIAQIRYFNAVRGSEIPKTNAYALMVEYNGNYINILNPFFELPVYERSFIPNQTLDGEYYGSKIYLVNGEVKNGLCYILETKGFSSNLPHFNSMSEVEEYVLSSSLFFLDRIDLILSKKKQHKYGKVLLKDLELKESFFKEMELQEKNATKDSINVKKYY